MNHLETVVYLNGQEARVVKITPHAFIVETKFEKGIFPKSDFQFLSLMKKGKNYENINKRAS